MVSSSVQESDKIRFQTLGVFFINLVHSSVNCFCFSGSEDFRKMEKEIQHKKPGLLKQHRNSGSWRVKHPCSEFTWLLEVPVLEAL